MIRTRIRSASSARLARSASSARSARPSRHASLSAVLGVTFAATLLALLVALAGPARAAAPGSTIWTNQWNTNPRGVVSEVSLATAPGQGLYVAAAYQPSAQGTARFLVVRYSRAGVRSWVRRFILPHDIVMVPLAIAVDRKGNAVLTGIYATQATGDDWLTVKYSKSGKRLWYRRLDVAKQLDVAEGVVVNGKGQAYVTGFVTRANGTTDALTVKYSPKGAVLWKRGYDGAAHLSDSGQAISLDHHGNVYVAGYTHGGADHQDELLIKYSPSGHRDWVYHPNSPANGTGEFRAVSTSPSTVAAAGETVTPVVGVQLSVVEMALDSNLFFSAGSVPQSLSVLQAVAVGPANTVVSSGRYGDQFYVQTQLANGLPGPTYLWPGFTAGIANKVAVTSDGSMYASGNLIDNANVENAAVVALDPNGVPRWSFTASSGLGKSSADGLIYTSTGVYVAMNVGPDLVVTSFVP